MTLVILFLVSTSVSAIECFDTKRPGVISRDRPVATIDNRFFFGTHRTRKDAVIQAKAYGLCVEDYGVNLSGIELLTKKALEWQKTKGYSVWKR